MNKYMDLALEEAKKSILINDVPVGAVIVENGKILAKTHNTKEKNKIVTRHAEINAIEKACKKKKNWYLNNCELYVTLEPCEMCKGAIEAARINKVVYAVKRDKNPIKTTKFEHESYYSKQAQKLLSDFFKNKRK